MYCTAAYILPDIFLRQHKKSLLKSNSYFDIVKVNEEEESTEEVVFPTHASLSDDVSMKSHNFFLNF